MNNITSQRNNEAVALKHKEYVLDKAFSFFQLILIELISRVTSVNINHTSDKTSVQLSFNNDYPQN